MEKFPQVPDLVFNSLQQLPRISRRLDLLAQESIERKNHRYHHSRRKLIALLAFGAAGYFLYRDTRGSTLLRDGLITDLSPSTIALLAIGLLAIWFRK